MDFLRRISYGVNIDVGEKVVIIGGGFTANDCARTALRLGARDITIMYRRREIDRPGYPSMNADEEMEETTEEGIKYLWEVTPFEYIQKDGRIVAVKYWMNDMIIESRGRAKPVPRKEKVLTAETDIVLEATGQESDYTLLGDEFLGKLRLTPQGYPIVNEGGMTSIPGVFSAGDSTNITKDLISAVRDADKAVLGILTYLSVLDKISYKDLPILDRWKRYSPTIASRTYFERSK